MTGKLSKNFHGVGIGPLPKIYAVNRPTPKAWKSLHGTMYHRAKSVLGDELIKFASKEADYFDLMSVSNI